MSYARGFANKTVFKSFKHGLIKLTCKSVCKYAIHVLTFPRFVVFYHRYVRSRYIIYTSYFLLC